MARPAGYCEQKLVMTVDDIEICLQICSEFLSMLYNSAERLFLRLGANGSQSSITGSSFSCSLA